MRFKLRFAKSAARDIKQVLKRTFDQFGEQQHEQYKQLISRALSDIAAHPDSPPARKRPELRSNARTFHISRRGRPARHFFVYRIIDGGFVEISRLLHDSMDLQRHLPEGFEQE